MYKFSLRFYHQTDENVQNCILQLKEICPEILGSSQDKVFASMSGLAPSHQMYLHFADESAARRFLQIPKGREIYESYAPGGAKAVVREPGDYAVGI